MVRSLFGNSNRKLRSTFWGSPFIPVGTNQTECCLPLTNFSVPSRFQTHATQIRPFLDSNRNGCGIPTVNWQIAYHYAFANPTGFFCQMVSTPGFRPGFHVWFRSTKKLWQKPKTQKTHHSPTKFPFNRVSNQNWFLGHDHARLTRLVLRRAICSRINRFRLHLFRCCKSKSCCKLDSWVCWSRTRK